MPENVSADLRDVHRVTLLLFGGRFLCLIVGIHNELDFVVNRSRCIYFAVCIKKNEAGIKIESIDDEIDYRIILSILTAKGYAYENTKESFQSTLQELKAFFTEIIKEGQKNGEIRHDLSTENIVDSLIIMYIGIQYNWEIYLIDDMISVFEDNFNLEWEKIRFRE